MRVCSRYSYSQELFRVNHLFGYKNFLENLEYEKFVIHSLNCFKVLHLFLQIS